MNQKPSVGRIVHFYAPEGCAGPKGLDGPYAGIITGVRVVPMGSTQVEVCSLMTFGPSGSTYPHSDVAYSPEPMPGRWTWPPRV